MESTTDKVYATVKANPNKRLSVLADEAGIPPRVFVKGLKRLMKQGKITQNPRTSGSLLPPTYRA